METAFEKYKAMGDLIASQGQTFVIALVILVVGLIVSSFAPLKWCKAS